MWTETVLICPHCGSDKIDEDHEGTDGSSGYCYDCEGEFEEPDRGAQVDPDSRWDERRIEL